MTVPTWGETAKGVKIIDGEGNPTGSTDNPLPVTTLTDGEAGIPLLTTNAVGDAFGRLRVSSPVSVFDSQLQYDLRPLLWESGIANNSGSAAVAHLPLQSAALMTAGAADTVVRQSRQYYRYQPGKSQYILMTWGGFTPATGVTRRIGYFDGGNGVFFQAAGSTPAFVIRNNGVDNSIPQSEWSENKLASLDLTKAQILAIDLEWLGVGQVRCGFVIDGQLVICHKFKHANVSASTYMQTANLPLRYEITSEAGTAGTHTLTQICGQISSEGGVEEERNTPFAAGNGATLISGLTTRRPVFSIRPTLTFNSLTNRSMIVIESIDVYSDDASLYWEIVYGGTLAGASFAAVNATHSAVEKDVAATAISGGIIIAHGYVSAGGAGVNKFSSAQAEGLLTRLPLTLNIAGVHPTTPFTDILSIVCTSAGAATDTGAGFSWRELK